MRGRRLKCSTYFMFSSLGGRDSVYYGSCVGPHDVVDCRYRCCLPIEARNTFSYASTEVVYVCCVYVGYVDVRGCRSFFSNSPATSANRLLRYPTIGPIVQSSWSSRSMFTPALHVKCMGFTRPTTARPSSTPRDRLADVAAEHVEE